MPAPPGVPEGLDSKGAAPRQRWRSSTELQIASFGCPLISTQAAGPWRIRVIGRGSTDHLHPPDLAVLDQKRLSHQDARRPVEALELVRPAVGEDAFIDGSLVEHRLRPDHAALAVDHRVSASVDVLHHEVVAELKLPHA